VPAVAPRGRGAGGVNAGRGEGGGWCGCSGRRLPEHGAVGNECERASAAERAPSSHRAGRQGGGAPALRARPAPTAVHAPTLTTRSGPRAGASEAW
jgi:hypothetical protein